MVRNCKEIGENLQLIMKRLKNRPARAEIPGRIPENLLGRSTFPSR